MNKPHLTVFFTRTGTDEGRTSRGQKVSMDLVVRLLSGHSSKYFEKPPIINDNENPSSMSPYTHTVIEAEETEMCAAFSKAGYYWFPTLPPAECQRLLELDEPAR